MQIVHKLKEFKNIPSPSAVAIGNFDGIHLGHQKILEALVTQAKKNKLKPICLTFDPHTANVIHTGRIKLIQTLDQKLEKINQFRIHTTMVLGFDKDLAALTSLQFIQNIVLKALNAKEIIIGENFRFGKNRGGDISSLKSMASDLNFSVHAVPSVTLDDVIVSSSLIRNLISEGKVQESQTYLGRAYEIEGTVIKGESRGASLGFPTANLLTANEILPSGVFITSNTLEGEDYISITNIGIRPTYHEDKLNIESHIIGLNQDFYGKQLTIRFLKKIRDEMRFASPEELAAQIHKDLQYTKSQFQNLIR
jgi:riboflavin kinase/FMN adenylyltransferase